ncbi:ubiquitin-like small modifier protein 1 [Haloarchaeobius sp. HME9146]|uniref:ubiquitin-like small modifier protein 1 n=1 Tax=Haloarchaeobius sp. HME9146 TaxID=2978732 RepID=UPI0021C1F85D|nr:ubiquitin-like small modifier protein 1 [Haloarchaeobius sp. HME9146]MCT9097747.1 MoaD/ThiS family protein [Haloarchaeobius sp. HME9146]
MHWKLFADLAEVAGAKEVDVDVAAADPTVGDALDALFDAHPGLRDRVLDDEGDVAPQINILKNGSNVQMEGEGMDEPVTEDDELALFPPVSGGSA